MTASSTHSTAPVALPTVASSARAVDRCEKRIAIFICRGMTEQGAERLADRLVGRDHDRDDRRCCDECSRLQRGWRCAAGYAPLPGVLQRCADFDWQTA